MWLEAWNVGKLDLWKWKEVGENFKLCFFYIKIYCFLILKLSTWDDQNLLKLKGILVSIEGATPKEMYIWDLMMLSCVLE